MTSNGDCPSRKPLWWPLATRMRLRKQRMAHACTDADTLSCPVKQRTAKISAWSPIGKLYSWHSLPVAHCKSFSIALHVHVLVLAARCFTAQVCSRLNSGCRYSYAHGTHINHHTWRCKNRLLNADDLGLLRECI